MKTWQAVTVLVLTILGFVLIVTVQHMPKSPLPVFVAPTSDVTPPTDVQINAPKPTVKATPAPVKTEPVAPVKVEPTPASVKQSTQLRIVEDYNSLMDYQLTVLNKVQFNLKTRQTEPNFAMDRFLEQRQDWVDRTVPTVLQVCADPSMVQEQAFCKATFDEAKIRAAFAFNQ